MPIRSLDAALRRYGPVVNVGVALSGGGDSVALLHAAVSLAKKRGFKVFALHVNHGLRPEAKEESEFCQKICETLNVRFSRVDLDAGQFNGNLHDAARRARYQALEKMTTQHGIDLVLTAHTLDDQAETVIQRILRGTGPTGLAGIQERHGIFARPWLRVSRAEIRSYLTESGFDWCEDSSNQDPRYMRTQIRHRILPLLSEIGGRGVTKALGRLAQLSLQERAILDEIAENDCRDSLDGDDLLLERLQGLSGGRRALVLRRWLADRGIIPPMQVIRDLDSMVMKPGPAGPYQLSGGLSVAKDYRTLVWEKADIESNVWQSFPADQPVSRAFADGRLRLRVQPGISCKQGFAAQVNPETLEGAFWMPSWPAARFQPRGMEGTIKCQDLFVNEKIPKKLRSYWPFLVKQDAILLVAGIRAAQELPLHDPRKDTWTICLEWLD